MEVICRGDSACGPRPGVATSVCPIRLDHTEPGPVGACSCSTDFLGGVFLVVHGVVPGGWGLLLGLIGAVALMCEHPRQRSRGVRRELLSLCRRPLHMPPSCAPRKPKGAHGAADEAFVVLTVRVCDWDQCPRRCRRSGIEHRSERPVSNATPLHRGKGPALYRVCASTPAAPPRSPSSSRISPPPLPQSRVVQPSALLPAGHKLCLCCGVPGLQPRVFSTAHPPGRAGTAVPTHCGGAADVQHRTHGGPE